MSKKMWLAELVIDEHEDIVLHVHPETYALGIPPSKKLIEELLMLCDGIIEKYEPLKGDEMCVAARTLRDNIKEADNYDDIMKKKGGGK